jgi:prepilin-type processing-associated H-X9-DG protein
MYMWDYMEERALAGKNDLTKPFFVDPASATMPVSMNGLCGQYVRLYYCPDDTQGNDQSTAPDHPRRRGNYVVNWGNSTLGQVVEPFGKAPFSHIQGNPSRPRLTKITMISDGTSHTLMMSECLRGWTTDDNDWRGDFHNDQAEFRFHTLLTPNSSAPDIINRFTATNDPLMPAATGPDDQQVTAARSRHRGGVNVCFCDGSVKFISDFIQLNTWKALGSMDGGDTPGNF